jgi:hypothetical protein
MLAWWLPSKCCHRGAAIGSGGDSGQRGRSLATEPRSGLAHESIEAPPLVSLDALLGLRVDVERHLAIGVADLAHHPLANSSWGGGTGSSGSGCEGRHRSADAMRSGVRDAMQLLARLVHETVEGRAVRALDALLELGVDIEGHLRVGVADLAHHP